MKNSYLVRVQELDNRVRSEETVFEAAKAALDALNIVNADVLQEDSRDVCRRILTDRERQDFENSELMGEAKMLALGREEKLKT